MLNCSEEKKMEDKFASVEYCPYIAIVIVADSGRC